MELFSIKENGNLVEAYDKYFDYYINLEEGVVAAVMRDPLIYFAKNLDDIDKKLSVTFPHRERHAASYAYLGKPIRAKATCHPDDEFDLDEGIKIARKKCVLKATRKLGQVYVELNNLLDPAISYVEDTLITLSERINRIENELAEEK
jgi:hypothetical protein